MEADLHTPGITNRHWRLMQAGLIVLLVAGSLLIYYPALKAGFIWDDDVHFTANRSVARWKGLIDIWSSRDAVYYPLVLTTGWALHKAAGFNPVVFHGANLLLHLAASLSLVAVLKRFRINGAWLAGFLFAWHPMQVESVAWVSELKNTQSAFLLMCSILALQQSGFFKSTEPGDKKSRRWYWCSVGLFLLALLSKPSVVLIPVALAAVVWWKRGVKGWGDLDGLFPFFILSLLASGWTVWEQRYNSGAQGFEWTQTVPERLMLSGQVMWFYLHKLCWPEPLMFIYPQWNIRAGTMVSLMPMAVLIAIGVICWWKRNSWGRYPGLIMFWFALMIFPVTGLFNVYFMRYAWVSDHFVYLAGISIFAGAGAVWAMLYAKQRVAALCLAAVLLMVCGWRSHVHARTFHNQETLWNAALKENPAAWIAHNNLGLILRDRGDQKDALYHFQQALHYNPRHYEAMNNLGTLYQAQGNREEALAYYDRALELKPELYRAWVNRGNLLREMNDVDGAYASYQKALEIYPRLESALVHTALLAEEQGDGARAVAAYQKLLRNNKCSDDQIGGFLYERAYKIAGQGNADLALQFLGSAEQMSPNLADIHLLKGDIHERRYDYSAAEKSYRIALVKRPGWGAAALRLSKILALHPDPSKRQPKEAFTMLDAMMAAGGQNVPEIVEVYAMALGAGGRYGEAMQAQRHAMSLVKDQPDRVKEMESRLNLYEIGTSYQLPTAPVDTNVIKTGSAETTP